MDEVNENLICKVCRKKYSSVSAKNRHLKDVHHEEPEKTSTVHIKCPICSEEEKTALDSHDMLIHHLEQIHSLSIKTSLFTFENETEFEAWRALDNRNIDYVKRSTVKTKDGKLVYYECNRSSYSGYTSQCSKRRMKTGGSIKICGFCPSRIHVKISSTAVNVKFFETHVGHQDDRRSKHLKKNQQILIVNKLTTTVKKESILEDPRTITNIERINVLTTADLGKRRDSVLGIKTSVDYDNDNNNLCMCESSTNRSAYDMDVKKCMETSQVSDGSVDSNTRLEILLEQTKMKLQLLDEDDIWNVAQIVDKAYGMKYNNASTNRKRKMEKHSYFPCKK